MDKAVGRVKKTKPGSLELSARLVRSVAGRKKLPEGARRRFPIVGVGASAGGLEAFSDLLRHLPADTGMGFVIIQHLDPLHNSALAHLLAQATTMPVCEATHHLQVKPNAVYVIPPNVQMSLAGGVLKLAPRSTVRGAKRTVDFFLEALALDQREYAIGIILSGTATDGTLGLEALKAEGGVTFAQDDSAKYNSMPRSAVAAGCVDYELPPKLIAAELARIAKHFAGAGDNGVISPQVVPAKKGAQIPPEKRPPERTLEGSFEEIFSLMRHRSGVDFSLYKLSTVQRRLARRLILNKQDTLSAYAAFLKDNEKELDALYADLLIGVTTFFRNREAFEALKKRIFPKLLAAAAGDEPLRVWVTGCSTGQEAYSLAMIYAEISAEITRGRKLQIFATDLNDVALKKARNGLYTRAQVQDVSPARLRQFFKEEDDGFRVGKSIREQVVFARHNVISDPPLSRMDLVSCRNMLIYLEPALQRKIFPAFHYALKPAGFLFLGASESIGDFEDLFSPAGKGLKIFARKAAKTPAFRQPLAGRRLAAPAAETSESMALGGGFYESGLIDVDAQRQADRILLKQYAPPGVLINAEGQVMQFRGATGFYLEPAAGMASFDLLKMARDGLMLPLRAVIQKARKEKKPVSREGVAIHQHGIVRTITIQVIPLRNLKETWLLVLFVNAGSASGKVAVPQEPSPKKSRTHEISRRIADLEHELLETREYLESTQTQNAATNDALQAASEEVQSSNEELQSLNEELETSKEELESTNEELTTVNEEMVGRNDQLGRLNADLNNLQESIDVAILLFGRDLTIRRFTSQAQKIFNLHGAEPGRALADIRHNLDFPGLEALLAEVIATMSMRECEIQDRAGRWYGLRARPYLTIDHKIDGVVLVLNDIDALKRGELEVRSARDEAEATVRAMPVPFLILNSDLRVNSASDAFFRDFKVTPKETEGKLIYELGNQQWNIPSLRTLLEEILPRKSTFNGYEVTHDFPLLGRRTVLLNARRLDSDDGTPDRIVLAIEDITARKMAETSQRLAMEEVERASRTKDDFLAALSHELRTPLTPVLMTAAALREDARLPADVHELLVMMERNIALEAQLIDDLLDLTIISRGKLQLRAQLCDAHALIKLAVEIVREDARAKGILLEVRLAAERCELVADPARFQQVIWNLLRNAVKFTPRGGRVSISTEEQRSEDGVRWLRIEVTDSGIGIEQQQLERIFLPFDQGGLTGDHRFGGLGLGLAIARAVVELHGGRISARSAGKDRGSAFAVEFPESLPSRTVQGPTLAGGGKRAAAKAGVEKKARVSLRLLLVEDHESTLKTLSLLLERDGHRVVATANFNDALAAAAAAPFDLVISDIGLPDGTGTELMEILRDRYQMRGIALSGYGMEEDFARSLEAGFSAHLVKPVHIAELRQLLATFPAV